MTRPSGRVMRELGLVACQPRPFRPVTTIAGDAMELPDLVRRDFTATAPGCKLVGDITYIPTWEGWLFLATVLDCFSKKVVGYAMADHMRTSLVAEASADGGQQCRASRRVKPFSTPTAAHNICPRNSRPLLRLWGCAVPSAGPDAATIMRGPNRSTVR